MRANLYGGSGDDQSGILVGYNDGGDITSSYASSGAVNGGGGNDILGGIVGKNKGSTSAIVASYAALHINGGAGADKAGGLVGDISSSSGIAACYAMGSVSGGAGNGDSVGGLVGTSAGSVTVTASYTTASVDGGNGTSDSAGKLIGSSTNTTIAVSYGFGTRVRWETAGEDGTTIPSSCGSDGMQECEASTLTLAAADTSVPNKWNAATSNTQNAWDFGTNANPHAPRLKYAAYGTGYSCTNTSFLPYGPPITCGTTELPNQTLPLSAITNFTATEANCASVNLAWDHPPEPNRKEVSITWTPDDAGGPTQPLVLNDFTTNTRGSSTITGLKDGTEYTFTILSRDQNDQSSSTVTAPAITTSACDPLGAPTGISSTPTNTTVKLQWTNPDEPDFSHVTISYPSGPTLPDQTGEPDSGDSFIVTGLSASTEYTFTLTAVDTSGITASTTHTVSTTTAATQDPNPSRIQNFLGTAVLLDCSKVNLEWDHPEELNRKEVRLTWLPAHGESQPKVDDDFTTNTRGSATITGLQDATDYTFSIVSRNTASSNSDSAAVEQRVMTATCDALEPPISISSVPRRDSVTLQWTNPVQKDFKHVTIAVSPTDKNDAPISISPQTGSPGATASYEVSNLKEETAYTFTLTAVDTSNNTAAAAAHTVSTPPDKDNDGSLDSVDVDDDNDGLIEIHNLDMLAHVHNNLAGTSYNDGTTSVTTGAPTAATDNCTRNVGTTENPAYLCGYELAKSLDFTEGASYASGSVNYAWRPATTANPTGASTLSTDPSTALNTGFPGIGRYGIGFNAIFEGNGLQIRHLYMRSAGPLSLSLGFFKATETGANIRNLGLVNANVYISQQCQIFCHVGGLVGENKGTLRSSYSTGTVHGGDGSGNDYVGGLVGDNNGTIIASYSRAAVYGGSGGYNYVGGLVGQHSSGSIIASYATGDVDGGAGSGDYVGGLVGNRNGQATIIASYATGAANGGAGRADYVGGLLGWQLGGVLNTRRVIVSYGFGETSGGTDGGLGPPPSTCGADGDVKCTPSTLTLAAADPAANPTGTPPVLNRWNAATSNTLNAWKFGTSSDPHPPRLKYADYDDGGTSYSCSNDQFEPDGSAITCGTTELPDQELDTDGDGIPDGKDVDDDNDGLIEIHNLDMLANIKNNLAGTSYDDTDGADTPSDDYYDCDDTSTTSKGTFCGAPKELSGTVCPSGTTDVDTGAGATEKAFLCGYELTRDLDFADAASYASGSRNTTWCPIASTCNDTDTASTHTGFDGLGNETTTASSGGFAAIFEGNGFAISRLYMRNTSSTAKNMGLFRRTESTAVIRNLGLLRANLYGGSGNDQSGVLVGYNDGGDITSSYAYGGAVNGGGGDDILGGLVGKNEDSTSAITASYAALYVNGGAGADKAGGLVGDISSSSSIAACYAMGSVTGGADNDSLGGLVGTSASSVTVTASYATASVDGGTGTSDSVGKLIGSSTSTTIAVSYGFGTTSNVDNAGNDGTTIPSSCGDGTQECTAATLTLAAADTSVPNKWNAATSDTLNAWDFGTNASPHAPRLKYAAYGTGYSCTNTQFQPYGEAITCNTTDLPNQTHPLSPITNFTAAAGANCISMNLAWDHPLEPNRKEVSITWDPPDGTTAQPLVLNDFTTNPRGSSTVTGLKHNTSYTFTILSRDQNNHSSSTVEATATTSACSALQPPSSISATPTNTTVKLEWTNPTQLNFSHVTITYEETALTIAGADIPNQVGEPGSNDSFLVTGLKPSTQYTFTLRSVDTSGVSSSGSATSQPSTTDTTTPDPSPPRIENFEATAVLLNCTQIALEWDHPEELNRKEVRLTWSPAHGESQPKAFNDFATTRGSATITDLRDNTPYTFTIVSRNTDDEDSTGVPQTVTTSTCPALEAPTEINSTSGRNSITLRWKNPVQKDFKHVTIDLITAVGSSTTDNDGNTIASTDHEGEPGATDSHTISNLSVNTQYTFRLTAVDRSDNTTAATPDYEARTLPDADGDGVSDVEDVDDDNDGLIEIHSLDMLANINNNLDGTSYDSDGLDTGSTTFDACGATTPNGRGSICGAATADTAATIRNCGAGTRLCGYELARSLDFAEDSSYDTGSRNKAFWCPRVSISGCDGFFRRGVTNGFTGLGTNTANFNAIFEGNGLTISRLYMRYYVSDAETLFIGFFKRTSANASIRNLGLLKVYVNNVNISSHLGALVGHNSGAVIASYTAGFIQGSYATDHIGGLVGTNAGTIVASYSMAAINGSDGNDNAGGLVGRNVGNVSASYATGQISYFMTGNTNTGGLVGSKSSAARIVASYATGFVSGGGWSIARVGSLVGFVPDGGEATIVSSYGFGGARGGRRNNVGAVPSTCGVDGMTKCTPSTLTLAAAGTTQWNSAANDTLGAWDFGTSSDPHPPRLKYADYDDGGTSYGCSNTQFQPYGPDIICGSTELPNQELDSDGDGVLDSVDVDDDNDGLIEIHNLDMLFHVHYNLQGQAYDSTGSGTTDTDTATNVAGCGTTSDKGSFCGAPKTLMGTACPAGSTDVDPHATNEAYLCGYELTRDLDFADAASYDTGSRNTTWCPVASTCNGGSTQPGFDGIGNETTTASTGGFAAIFDGNGLSIGRLYMRNTSSTGKNMGLFRRTESTAVIRNLGLLRMQTFMVVVAMTSLVSWWAITMVVTLPPVMPPLGL